MYSRAIYGSEPDISIVVRKVMAVIGPTPGMVIKRRQVALLRTISSIIL